jgi:hypothetical protein
MDKIAEERRRLSAAWLNILAAGVITAGSIATLPVLVGTPWTATTSCLLALCIACLLTGFGLHLVARFILRRQSCPPQSEEHA